MELDWPSLFRRLTIVGLLTFCSFSFADGCGQIMAGAPPLALLADTFLTGQESFPSKVVPQLSKAIVVAFEKGPGIWVGTGVVSNLPYHFQRGLSGGNRDGSKEALQLLEGKKDSLSRAVLRYGDGYPDGLTIAPIGELESAARHYSYPLAVRGVRGEPPPNPNYSNGQRFHGIHPGGGILPQRSNIAEHITEMGLFFWQRADELYSYEWAHQYFKVFDALINEGMKIPKSSRGAEFHRELKAAFDKVDPDVEKAFLAYKNEKDPNKFGDRQSQLNGFVKGSAALTELKNVLLKYENQ
jgi:hypothetical protein